MHLSLCLYLIVLLLLYLVCMCAHLCLFCFLMSLCPLLLWLPESFSHFVFHEEKS